MSFGQSHRRQMPWHNWQQTAHLAKIYRHLLDQIKASTCFLYTLYSVHPRMMPTVHFCTISKSIPTHMLYTLLLTIKLSTHQLSFGFWPGNESALANIFVRTTYLAYEQTLASININWGVDLSRANIINY